MFAAGEGGPERTNKLHYVSAVTVFAKRLSTALIV
jgi:hypothetical protein